MDSFSCKSAIPTYLRGSSSKTDRFQREIRNFMQFIPSCSPHCHILALDMIQKNLKPDVIITIGEEQFCCHLTVLRCYSQFFAELGNIDNVTLPLNTVTPFGFKSAYDWMLAEEPEVKRKGILDIFKTATFLQITELVEQCWICFDDHERFSEDKAFLMYLEARDCNLKQLQQLMVIRVTKFFPMVIASQEFVDMDLEEVCEWLMLNSIGVNSEMEILMAVIRWLSYDWNERKPHALTVMNCVRFSLMPAWYLVMLREMNDCVEVQRVVAEPDINKMLENAMTINTIRQHPAANLVAYNKILQGYHLVEPTQRQWLYDPICSHHTELNNVNIMVVTYPSFVKYLEDLKKMNGDHWRSMQIMSN